MGSEVNTLLLIPFALLLIAIGVMPLAADVWWRKWYRQVSALLSVGMIVYYLVGRDGGSERVLHTLHEYVSFVAIAAALYVVTGGIHISLKGRSRPIENLVMLGIGAVAANLIGTTGASMLLIRPYLKNNHYRLTTFHVVFFIFIVSNIGGVLTPIGDPPLFLGYIRGVPFFRVAELTWLPWLVALGLLLTIFYILDQRNFHKVHAALQKDVLEEESPFRVTGLHNILFLAIIVGSVFIQNPPFLREGIMLGAAALSYLTTKKEIRKQNHFTFHPIEEVLWLFIAVFMTMMPALEWLTQHAGSIGLHTASHYYWGTGALSGVLDNAPTYLNFLTLAVSGSGGDVGNVAHVQSFAASQPALVMALSCGAVFFGAMTYIGNAPNFMVKSTAESMGVRVPHFFEYILKFSIPVLIPVFAIIWLIFL